MVLHREGAEVVIDVSDDGAGMNVKAIRDKAVAMGLVDPRHTLTDEEAMQLILEPGFSTAGSITKAAGRGVGMDVVATEVKKLGGALFIESTPGAGTKFTVRLPFTLAISQALIVRVVDEFYALPLPTVEGIVRLDRNEVQRHLRRRSAVVRLRRAEVPVPAPRRFSRQRAFTPSGRRRLRIHHPGARR